MTIQDGHANGAAQYDKNGAGITCRPGASPLIKNCLVRNNLAEAYGGGAFCNEAYPHFSHSVFTDNHANAGGGAVFSHGNNTQTEEIVQYTNCLFRRNTAIGQGGAIAYLSHFLGLRNCSFFGNQGYGGGAIYQQISCKLLAENCVFLGNKATHEGGGAIQGWDVVNTFRNCLFTGNATPAEGGALWDYSFVGPASTFNNCILWNNTADGASSSASNSVYSDAGLPFAFNNSLVQHIDLSGGGKFNLNGLLSGNAPLFKTPTDPSQAPTIHGNPRLLPGSPAIDAGDNSLVGHPFDRDEVPRVANGLRKGVPTVDLGPYEYQAENYSDWAKDANITNRNDLLLFADPNNDGIPNIQHFANGTDPLAPPSETPCTCHPHTVEHEGATYFAITIPVRTGTVFSEANGLTATLDGITYRITGSVDLKNFDRAVVVVHPPQADGLPALQDGWSYQTFRSDTPNNSGTSKLFLRSSIFIAGE